MICEYRHIFADPFADQAAGLSSGGNHSGNG
jgi:hypothetical protein